MVSFFFANCDKKSDLFKLNKSPCSATRTRTGVYGVRGRCPRPLDDSTFSKSAAKVLLFIHIHKFFNKKMQKICKYAIFYVILYAFL